MHCGNRKILVDRGKGRVPAAFLAVLERQAAEAKKKAAEPRCRARRDPAASRAPTNATNAMPK